ncbi:unnamed protein product [Spodoptera exigua]|nr:unnamed protein product [Spodoptera exigua]
MADSSPTQLGACVGDCEKKTILERLLKSRKFTVQDVYIDFFNNKTHYPLHHITNTANHVINVIY